MKAIKIFLLILVITFILFTLSIYFKQNKELITSYDRKTLEQRYGGDLLQVAGDWCMGDVRKGKNLGIFEIIPFTYSRVVKNSQNIECYYI